MVATTTTPSAAQAQPTASGGGPKTLSVEQIESEQIQQNAAAPTVTKGNTKHNKRQPKKPRGQQQQANSAASNGTAGQQQDHQETTPADDAQQGAKKQKNKRRRNNNKKANAQADVNGIANQIEQMGITADAETKTDPIFTLSTELKHSNCKVDIELIKSQQGDLIFIIRKSDLENNFSRIAMPFSMIQEIIDALNIGHTELTNNKAEGILSKLSDNQDVAFVNMLQKAYKSSRYYIDFRANQERNDISLQISEKKRIHAKSNSGMRIRTYTLEFNKFDMKALIDKLSQFEKKANQAISSQSLSVNPVYGGNDFNLEWFKPNREMNYLLKLQTSQSRIVFPVNTCRQFKTVLQNLIDAYESCGTDQEAYKKLMKEQRDKVNAERAQIGREPLPDIIEYIENSVKRASAPRFDSEGKELPSNPNILLYTQRVVSNANNRTYHHDLVLNAATGEVRLRIVEQLHQNPNREKAANRVLRHTVSIAASKMHELFETFSKAHDNVPLPKEASYYSPNGRVFMKFNIRPSGLTFKIKTQTVIHDNNEAQNQQQNKRDDDTASQNTHSLTKYGNTQRVEIPMRATKVVMDYLKKNTNFLDLHH